MLERSIYDRSEDGFFESLFALSNGRIGLRATVDFDSGGGHPGFFHYDLYGPAITVPCHLVNGFNPDYWRLFVDGVPVAIDGLVSFSQSLDLGIGKVALDLVFRDSAGRHTRIVRETFIPAQDAERIVTTTRAEALDHDLPFTVFVGFDWREGNGDFGGTYEAVRINNVVSRNIEITSDSIVVEGYLRGSEQRVTGRMSSSSSGAESRSVVERGRAMLAFRSTTRCLNIETRASIEIPPASCDLQATASLNQSMKEPLAAVMNVHAEIWRNRWAGAALLDGPERDVYGLRYAQFQLFQCADRYRSSSNVAARGLTSEYHSGHFFFNTEFYVGPYYALTEPAVAKSFLRFRGDTLEAAERYARQTGFRGARFPEEVDRNGNPAAPRFIRDPFSGSEKREWSGELVFHLSADVIHFLATYLDASGDQASIHEEFLPLVIRCAEYLADLMRFDEAVGGRGARNVMCFDEFHYGVDHHVATNALAAWALRWAAAQIESTESSFPLLAPTIGALGADGQVRQSWRDIADEIFLPAARADGVWPIFNGYFDLPDQLRTEDDTGHLPLIDSADQERVDNLEPFSTTLAKQADVVFLMTTLPALADDMTLADNLAYYEPRTLHGSSLSLAPHAHAAARVGDSELARKLIVQSARYNLDFRPRAWFQNGVHFGAYAGAILAIVRGLVGFEGRQNTLSFDPALPHDWRELRITLAWQGHRIAVRATHDIICITDLGGGSEQGFLVQCRGKQATLRPRGEVIFSLSGEPGQDGSP